MQYAMRTAHTPKAKRKCANKQVLALSNSQSNQAMMDSIT
jgi:hypothetical protein